LLDSLEMKIAMQPLLVAATVWLLPLCVAVKKMETEMEMESDENLIGSQGEVSEKKEAFTPKQCEAVVKKVQESGRYTEESITPVCAEEMGRSSNCEFFAEALSLASSHSDFQGKHFCEDMDRAQFCSQIMDKLLESTAVSDLAFGECERAKPAKNVEYCRRIQMMLGLSVKQEDLDTMRACYMQEAYTNSTSKEENKTKAQGPPAAEPTAEPRILGSSKELEGVGKGDGPGHPPKTSNIGRPGIVVEPIPLASFGEGKGNMTAPKSIITKPLPAGAAPAAAAPAGAAPAATATAPAAAAPAPPPGPIVAQPIPAPVEKSALQTSVSKVKAAPVAKAAPATIVVASSPKLVAAVPAKKVQALVAKVVKVTPAAVKQIVQVVEVKTVDTKQNVLAEPLVAQATLQNGKLVMTGATFGRVEVDQKGIEDALRKQAALSAAAKPVAAVVAAPKVAAPAVVAAAPKQVPAVKQAPTPKQATAPKPIVEAALKPAAAPVAPVQQVHLTGLVVAASATKPFGVVVPPPAPLVVAPEPQPKIQQMQPIVIVVQAQAQPAPKAAVPQPAALAAKPTATKPAVAAAAAAAAPKVAPKPVAAAIVAKAPVVQASAAKAPAKVAAKLAPPAKAKTLGKATKAVPKKGALAQKNLKVKKNEYKGFLSGFVD